MKGSNSPREQSGIKTIDLNCWQLLEKLLERLEGVGGRAQKRHTCLLYAFCIPFYAYAVSIFFWNFEILISREGLITTSSVENFKKINISRIIIKL